MGEVSTIGVDIAKSVFQVHGVDAEGIGLDWSGRKELNLRPHLGKVLLYR